MTCGCFCCVCVGWKQDDWDELPAEVNDGWGEATEVELEEIELFDVGVVVVCWVELTWGGGEVEVAKWDADLDSTIISWLDCPSSSIIIWIPVMVESVLGCSFVTCKIWSIFRWFVTLEVIEQDEVCGGNDTGGMTVDVGRLVKWRCLLSASGDEEDVTCNFSSWVETTGAGGVGDDERQLCCFVLSRFLCSCRWRFMFWWKKNGLRDCDGEGDQTIHAYNLGREVTQCGGNGTMKFQRSTLQLRHHNSWLKRN